MTKTKEANANTKPGVDKNDPTADVRLKSILPVIATQLIPVKEALVDFAKTMLANTTHLNKRIATLEKFNSTETSSSMPQLSNDMSPYVPKSARIKLTLQYSTALANDTTLKDLRRS
jgi:hypothetical protein